MKRLEVGQKMENFVYNTPYEQNIDLMENIQGKKAVIFFLRYFGCSICQLDLIEIQENIQRFKDKGIEVKAVLQSDPELMVAELSKNPLDYEIICDPDQELYKRFAIEPATSKLKLGGGNTLLKVAKAKKLGIEHGAYEGEELQLPAVIAVNAEGEIILSHYGKNAADLPEIDEILDLFD